MFAVYRRLTLAIILFVSFLALKAQPQVNPAEETKKETKPYMVFTAGKQITVKSTQAIKNIMLWTTSGDRVIEQREINNNSYSFEIPVNQKNFFLMVGLNDGKIYTEKIGIR